MAVTRDNNRWEYDGNGVAVDFDVDERIDDAAHLLVYLVTDETTALQTNPSNYSLIGLGQAAGCTVHFTTAPATGVTVLIRRELPYTQPTSIRNLGRFNAGVHEDAFDRLTGLVQQVAEKVARSLRGAVTGAPVAEVALTTVAGKFAKVNAGGTGFEFVSGEPSEPLSLDGDDVAASSGQVDFTAITAYTPGTRQLAVYKQGLKLVVDRDYTETSTTSFRLTTPATVGQIVEHEIGTIRSVSLLMPAKRERLYVLTAGVATVTSTIAYVPGNNECTFFLNGAKIELGKDILETNATTFTLTGTIPWATDDELSVIYGQAFDPASLNLTQADLGAILYPTTPPEDLAGVTPVYFWYPPGDDRRYGATGNGTTNDRVALQASLSQWVAGGSAPSWRPRTYNLGSITSADDALEIAAAARGVLKGNGARLVVSQGDATQNVVILRVADSANIAIEDITGHDTTYGGETSRGAILLDIVATALSDAEIGNIALKGVSAENCNTHTRVRGNTVDTASTNQSNRIRGVHFGAGCRAEDCAYGIQALNHGDYITGRLECDGVRTPATLIGVVGFDVDLYSRNPVGSSSHVRIAAFDRSAGHGRARLFLHAPAATPVPFSLEFQNTTQDESITDLDLHFSLQNEAGATLSASAPIVRFRALDASSVERATTTNVWDNIRLHGDWSTQTAPILVTSTPSTEGRIMLDPSLNRGMDVVDPVLPGFVFLQGDAEIRTKYGDLTSGNMFVIPCARYDGAAFALEVAVYAQANSGTPTSAHAIKVFVVHGYNASGGNVTVSAATAVHSYYNTTDPTVTFTASGENINVTLAGSGYNNAAATARMTVRKLARFA